MHPSVPNLHWQDVKEWHVTHLYENAMRLGIWSQQYFLTGEASPLEPETIDDRVYEVLECFKWLEENGYISNFHEEGTLAFIEESYRPISSRHKAANLRDLDKPQDVNFTPRQSPGSLIPPTREQHVSFLAALTPGTHRLAAVLIYEIGFRVSELIEDTLLPGLVHTRDQDALFHLPTWPTRPYLLNWSANDDKMIGVLPTREQAWNSIGRDTTDCPYRIVGKGLVIRRVDVNVATAQSIYRYVDGPRSANLRRNGRVSGEQPAQLLLNRFGEPLSVHAVQDAFRRASIKADCGYRFTAHVLRHMFACDFLRAATLARAKQFGDFSPDLTFEMLEKHGDAVVNVLQKRLGHALRETTLIYLEQVKLSTLGLAHTISWNDHLDGDED
jgi:integrase